MGGISVLVFKKSVEVIYRILKKIFVPSKKLSVFFAQLCMYLFLIALVGVLINQTWIIEYSGFFLSSIIDIAFIYWLFSYFSFLKFRKDPLYFKVAKQKDYPHQYSEISKAVENIDEIEVSVMKWAKENYNQNALEKLKSLNLYHRVSSGRKDLDFLYNSLIAVIFGVITTVIFNPDIMNTYKTYISERFPLVNEYVIYYMNGVTIFFCGVIVSLYFLKEKHLMNRKTELYESILDRVISKLEHKESD